MCCATRRHATIVSHSRVVFAFSRQKLTRAELLLVFGMLAAHACARVLVLSQVALSTDPLHCANSAEGARLCGHQTQLRCHRASEASDAVATACSAASKWLRFSSAPMKAPRRMQSPAHAPASASSRGGHVVEALQTSRCSCAARSRAALRRCGTPTLSWRLPVVGFVPMKRISTASTSCRSHAAHRRARW
jgi:hypothetical protein